MLFNYKTLITVFFAIFIYSENFCFAGNNVANDIEKKKKDKNCFIPLPEYSSPAYDPSGAYVAMDSFINLSTLNSKLVSIGYGAFGSDKTKDKFREEKYKNGGVNFIFGFGKVSSNTFFLAVECHISFIFGQSEICTTTYTDAGENDLTYNVRRSSLRMAIGGSGRTTVGIDIHIGKHFKSLQSLGFFVLGFGQVGVSQDFKVNTPWLDVHLDKIRKDRTGFGSAEYTGHAAVLGFGIERRIYRDFSFRFKGVYYILLDSDISAGFVSGVRNGQIKIHDSNVSNVEYKINRLAIKVGVQYRF